MFVFRFRGYFLFFYSFLLWIHIQYTNPSVSWLGLFICLGGWSVRLVSSLYIDEHTNDTKLNAKRLATKGIYGEIRHPIYLSNILVGVGLLVWSGVSNGWVQVTFFIVILIHHIYLSKKEEIYLLQKYKTYQNYLKKVSRRFIPPFFSKSFKASWKPRYTLKQAFGHQRNNFFNLLFLLIFLGVK